MTLSFLSLPASAPSTPVADLPSITGTAENDNSAQIFQELFAQQKMQTKISGGVEALNSQLPYQNSTQPIQLSVPIPAAVIQVAHNMIGCMKPFVQDITCQVGQSENSQTGEIEAQNVGAITILPEPITIYPDPVLLHPFSRPKNGITLDKDTAPKQMMAVSLIKPSVHENIVVELATPKVSAFVPALNTHMFQEIQTATVPQITVASAINPQQNFADRQLDFARDQLWLGQLANDIVAAREVNDRLSFRLLPENLGRMDVDLQTSDSGLQMQIKANNEEAAKLVAAAQPRLIEELRSQGIRVNAAEVTHGELAQHGKSTHHHAAPETPEISEQHGAETAEIERPETGGRFA